jgi:hypothetical protein
LPGLRGRSDATINFAKEMSRRTRAAGNGAGPPISRVTSGFSNAFRAHWLANRIDVQHNPRNLLPIRTFRVGVE